MLKNQWKNLVLMKMKVKEHRGKSIPPNILTTIIWVKASPTIRRLNTYLWTIIKDMNKVRNKISINTWKDLLEPASMYRRISLLKSLLPKLLPKSRPGLTSSTKNSATFSTFWMPKNLENWQKITAQWKRYTNSLNTFLAECSAK